MSTSTTGRLRSARGRRASRPSGDDRELAILATAERLLAQRPLGEISTDDLARGAGISRPTFYFYFRSKDEVLLALLDRTAQEADAASLRVKEENPADPVQGWRESIGAFYETFREHRAIAGAAMDARATNAEIRALWTTMMETWTERVAETIEAERERGAAPPGLPARDLAIALNSMNERVLHATFAGYEPAVPESDVVEVLLGVWLNAIYQTPNPPRR
jgi:TetR/AcrR family transcriptional regulator, ethionamide resistance regulator